MARTVEVVTSIERLADEWDALADRLNAPVFVRGGWMSAWWRAFGKGSMEVLAVRDQDALSAVVPMYRRHGALRSLTNSETPLFGVVANDPRALPDIAAALFGRRARNVSMSFVAEDDPWVNAFGTAARRARYSVVTGSWMKSPYVIVDGSWDAYVSGLRKKLRSELSRRRRRLSQLEQLRLDVKQGDRDLERSLEEGFAIEAAGWKAERGTAINSKASTRRFYTDIARWAAARGWLRLAFLRLGDRGIAFDFCLEQGGTHYLVKTGYDSTYSKYAPGMLLRYEMLARAFSEGLKEYDFLGSDPGWKYEWTNTTRDRLRLEAFSRSLAGSADRAIYVYGRPAARRLRATLLRPASLAPARRPS